MSVGEAFQSARLLHAGRTADGRSQVAEVGLTDLEADLRTTTDRQLRPLLVQTLCKETHIALSLKCMVPFWLHDDALTKQKENPRSIIFCLQALASRLGNMCHTVVFFFFCLCAIYSHHRCEDTSSTILTLNHSSQIAVHYDPTLCNLRLFGALWTHWAMIST